MKQKIIQEDSFDKARKKIKENKGKEIIFTSKDDDLNRKILEKENIDVLLISLSDRKDRMKQRDSGFNQVLAKIAKKKNIKIGINLDEITESKGVEQVKILSRLRQNIKLCNKNKIKMVFISQERKKGNLRLKSLGIVLGMPTNMAKFI